MMLFCLLEKYMGSGQKMMRRLDWKPVTSVCVMAYGVGQKMMRRLDWKPVTSVCVVAEEYGVGAEDDEEVGLEADHVRLRGGGGVRGRGRR